MKIFITISSLILLSHSAMAGGHWPCQDSPGGCQMPTIESVELTCPQVQIRLDYNASEADLGSLEVFQNNSNSHVYYSYHLSQVPGQGRVVSYSDSFCSRQLSELSQSDWLATSTCEGRKFFQHCTKNGD